MKPLDKLQQSALLSIFNYFEHSVFTNVPIASSDTKDILMPGSPDYEYMTLNPLKARTQKCDANVSEFRNFLVEWDDESLSFDAQIARAKELGLPYTLAIESAGKSVHFIVALTENVGQCRYEQLAFKLIDCVCKSDRKVKSPSSFCRFPGGLRKKTGNRQTIREVGRRITPDELETWLEEKMPKGSANQIRNLKPGEFKIRVLRPTTLAFFTFGAQEHWDDTLFASACNAFEFGWSVAQVFLAVSRINGRIESGDVRCIGSAFKRVFNRPLDRALINQNLFELQARGFTYKKSPKK